MNIQTRITNDSLVASGPIQNVLAEFAANLKHEEIPDVVRVRAMHHMLDAAGIAQASTRYDFAHKTLAGLRALAGEGDVPVFGMTAALPFRDAATMNGFLCHGLDYDDTHIAGIVHPTASVLPAVLSAAAHVGATGHEMVTAFVIGIETAARIGMCAKSQFHQVGFHPTGIVGIFGCTLAAGRLLGLNAKQLQNAQGLAVSMASGCMEFVEDGAWNKRFHPGWAASSGITAAVLAKEGFVGITAPYDGRFGLFNAYLGCSERTELVDLSLATAGLKTKWELLDTAIKPFPTCHFTHAAIDAALLLREEIEDLAAIKAITVKVPQGVHKTICEPVANKLRPKNDYDAKFSVQFLVAAALVRGQLTLAELEPDALADPAILAVTDKVSCADYPDSPFPEAYSGEVIIELADGRTINHREHINRGAGDRPLTNDEIIAKFRENAAMLVNEDLIDRQQDAMLMLDETENALEALWVFSG